MNWAGFMDYWRGRGDADYDRAYGNQCVDLFNFYNRDVVGAGWIPCDGAYQLWDNINNYAGDKYARFANTPDNWPEPGDVVIWRGNGKLTGWAGHVAIATGRQVGTTQFQSFDQNWPLNSLPHEQWHTYDDVIGWLRPRKFMPVPVPVETPVEQPTPAPVPQTPAPVEPSQPDSVPTPEAPVPAPQPEPQSPTPLPSSPDPVKPDQPENTDDQTENPSNSQTPPTADAHTSDMKSMLLAKLTSRKFLLALLGIGAAVVGGLLDYLTANQSATLLGAVITVYTAVEGWVDKNRS